jgi:hypothetical protein
MALPSIYNVPEKLSQSYKFAHQKTPTLTLPFYHLYTGA